MHKNSGVLSKLKRDVYGPLLSPEENQINGKWIREIMTKHKRTDHMADH